MKLRVLDEADAEAAESALWYEQRSEGLGFRFLDEIDRAFLQIQSHPNRHPQIESPNLSGEVRYVALEEFPYIVVYQVREECAFVLAIAHTSRDQDFWTRRLQD